jgi:hypothetical protein
MENESSTSLDRFVRTQAGSFLGTGNLGENPRTWRIAGALQVIGGLGTLTVGSLPGMQGFLFVGAWLTLQGIYYLGTGARIGRALQSGPIPGLRLTQEAEALLSRLADHVTGGFWLPWKSGENRCREVLTPEAFEMLEEAAFQFNRLQGLLAAGQIGAAAVAERLRPLIRVAAEEAMAAVLHSAALVQQFPESAAAHRATVTAPMRGLRELADRVEHLLGQDASLLETLPQETALERALAELGTDAVAREELRSEIEVQEIRPAG